MLKSRIQKKSSAYICKLSTISYLLMPTYGCNLKPIQSRVRLYYNCTMLRYSEYGGAVIEWPYGLED